MNSPFSEARVASWITWCTFAGCGRCIRNDVGQLIRPHCAEHAEAGELLRFVSTPLAQAHQVLGFYSMREVPRA